jgi:hypothetical protein
LVVEIVGERTGRGEGGVEELDESLEASRTNKGQQHCHRNKGDSFCQHLLKGLVYATTHSSSSEERHQVHLEDRRRGGDPFVVQFS